MKANRLVVENADLRQQLEQARTTLVMCRRYLNNPTLLTRLSHENADLRQQLEDALKGSCYFTS